MHTYIHAIENMQCAVKQNGDGGGKQLQATAYRKTLTSYNLLLLLYNVFTLYAHTLLQTFEHGILSCL